MSSSSSSSDISLIMSSSSSDEECERRSREFKVRINYFDILDDIEFIHRFRLSKSSAQNLIEDIGGDLQRKTKRNNALSPQIQLLIALRYYALGSIILVPADFIGVSNATAGRVVWKVSQAICKLRTKYIKMDNEPKTKENFFNIAKFPCVIGAIDCTHIRIQSPGGDDAEVFRNRKGYFSLNVQCVCDADLMIKDIVVEWPGSTHDATIFNSSTIKQRMDNQEFGDSMLVGDSGYTASKYMMTPLPEPRTPQEILYNESQIRTRNCIERCFGVWKRRFPALYMPLRLSIVRAQAVIVATAILHNICRLMAVNLPDEPDLPDVNHYDEPHLHTMEFDPPLLDHHMPHSNDNRFRQDLIDNYFANLR